MPDSRSFRIANLEEHIAEVAGTQVYRSVGEGTEVKKGLDMAAEVAGNAAVLAAAAARSYMRIGMADEVADKINTLYGQLGITSHIGFKPRTVKEFDEMAGPINQYLKTLGVKPINGHGRNMRMEIARTLKRFQGKLPGNAVNALKGLDEIAKAKMMLEKSKLSRVMKLKNAMHFKKYMRQTESGQGLVFTMTFVKRARMTLRAGLKILRNLQAFSRIAAKKLTKAAAVAAAKAAQTKAGQMLLNTKAGEVAKTTIKKTKIKANKAREGLEKITAKRRGIAARIRNFRRDPFRIRARSAQLATNLIGRLEKVAFLNKPIKIGKKIFKANKLVASALRKVMVAVSTVASTMIHFVLIAVAIILAICIFIVLLSMIISTICGAYDYAGSEEGITKAALEEIQKCYNAQMDEIKALNSKYRNVTVVFEDKRSKEQYKSEEHKTDQPIEETTNSAEIASMALVYFDFDLESAGKNKVIDYVRQLYYGSHTTSIVEESETVFDEEGEEITYTDATVTYTTYYFDDLFDCALVDSSSPNAYGVIQGSETEEQCWNYFRSAGFSEEATAAILGNLRQESGDTLNPKDISGGVAAGIAQWENYESKSGRWKNLDNFARARGKDWTDLQCQLDFILTEAGDQFSAYTGVTPVIANPKYDGLSGWPEKMTIAQFKKITDIDTAVVIWCQVYERAGNPLMSKRKEYAWMYYKTYRIPNTTEQRQRLVEAAYSQLGVPYKWGGTTPGVGLDCSGLVYWCYQQIGVNIPRQSDDIEEAGKVVTDPQPGDICWKDGHVGLYIGNGYMIHSPETGKTVERVSVKSHHMTEYLRFLND